MNKNIQNVFISRDREVAWISLEGSGPGGISSMWDQSAKREQSGGAQSFICISGLRLGLVVYRYDTYYFVEEHKPNEIQSGSWGGSQLHEMLYKHKKREVSHGTITWYTIKHTRHVAAVLRVRNIRATQAAAENTPPAGLNCDCTFPATASVSGVLSVSNSCLLYTSPSPRD